MRFYNVLFLFFSNISLVFALGTNVPKTVSGAGAASDIPEVGSGFISVATKCYGTNNRSTSNPLSPYGDVFLKVLVGKSDGSSQVPSMIITYPASIVKNWNPSVVPPATSCKYLEGTYAQIAAFNTSAKMTTALSTGKFSNLVGADGSSNCTTGSVLAPFEALKKLSKTDIQNIRIEAWQGNTNRGTNVVAFTGTDGRFGKGSKVSVKAKVLADPEIPELKNGSISINAVFPGQDGFCGGYHSPLMMFFNQERPSFTGETDLLKISGYKTYWVEKNHKGYFLARLDEKNPEKGIYRKNQLFGDNGGFTNGFSALSLLDDNDDRKVDSKDLQFKRLVMWKDIDGNGVSSKNELFPLSKFGVFQFDLDYDRSYLNDWGVRAVARGTGTFQYKSKGSKVIKKGDLVDIFFKASTTK